jgi:hypothetical protein
MALDSASFLARRKVLPIQQTGEITCDRPKCRDHRFECLPRVEIGNGCVYQAS